MSDPVMSDLGRHLSATERQEAKERKLDEWLDKAIPSDLYEFLDDRKYRQRFCTKFLVMLDEGYLDPDYGVIQMRRLLIEFLEEQASGE